MRGSSRSPGRSRGCSASTRGGRSTTTGISTGRSSSSSSGSSSRCSRSRASTTAGGGTSRPVTCGRRSAASRSPRSPPSSSSPSSSSTRRASRQGVWFIDLLLCLAFVAGSRLLARTLIERPLPGQVVARGKEAIVVGAGDAAQLVIKEMLRNPGLGYTPIGIVDDDPRKRNLRLHGIRVLGTTADLPQLIRDRRPGRGADRDAVGLRRGARQDRRGGSAGRRCRSRRCRG